MSATGHDAINGHSGHLPGLDEFTPDDSEPNPTADIADEMTTELVPGAPRPPELPAPPAAPVGSGTLLRDRYVLELPLGSGGSATVYRAIDRRREAMSPEGQRVAIKLLRPECRDRPEAMARLQREFRQTQTVAHANVVRLHDLDCDRGCWFIVMELLDGESLARAMRRAGPAGLARDPALRIALAVGEALANAHAQGVTHGDIKPGNIFLTRSGGVRLLDFGASPGAATRSYASPEVLAGADAEPRDDVYSLACVTCEMLTGSIFQPRTGPSPPQALVAPALRAALDERRWKLLVQALHPERAHRPVLDVLLDGLRDEGQRPAPVIVAPATREPANPPPDVPTPVAISAAAPKGPRRAAATVVASVALVLGILIGRLETARGPPQPEASPAIAEHATSAVATPVLVQELPPAEGETATPAAPPVARPAGPPGLVTFDSPTMRVSKRAVVAAIPLRHLTRVPRAVNVAWRLVDGTALAGRDYVGPLTGVESFVEGNSFRILYVPLVADPDAIHDRTFTVELTGATRGAEVGGAASVAVTIQGEA